MSAIFYLFALLTFGPRLWAEASSVPQTPFYTAASIVNAASNEAGALAPYTLVTLYGSDLAYLERFVSSNDILGADWPTELAGVRVLVNNSPGLIYFVSPKQVNLVVPDFAGPPKWLSEVTVDLVLVRDSVAGPTIPITLRRAAPALFQADAETVVAVRPDWTRVTRDAPAKPGEDVILYATGLGRALLSLYQEIPRTALPIELWSEFEVVLGGTPLKPARVLYVGVAPGFPGLYQINLKLPETLENDPEIRIGLAGQLSRTGLRLPVRVPESKSLQRLPSGMR